MTIKALIFDCDGLIVDTESPWYYAFCELYQDYQQKLPMELYVQCIGTHFSQSFDPFVYLESLTDQPMQREGLELRLQQIHHRLMEQEELRPGVLQYLKQAKEKGLKIGLASSSNEDWVLQHLNRYGITEYFDSILTSNHVQDVKPHPELYLKSLDKLNIKADEAIVFEDSKNGCLAAQAAGIYCVWIPNKMTQHLNFNEYDLQLSSMEDMKVKELIDSMKP